MLFSAGVFWLFYAIVLLLLQTNYLKIKSLRFQNITLLIASYFFYGYWDWKFLGLIILVTSQTFIAAYLISKLDQHKRKILFSSICINLLVLGYFKYVGFFVSEFVSTFNLDQNFSLENIILPVGISFYIFQSFTYVMDVYLRKIEPEKDPIKYFIFVAFFPQLVAGPIERASALLPQFNTLKGVDFDSLYSGIKIIIIGLFLKVFIADSLSSGGVDMIFSDYQNYNGGTLLLGALGFTVQIYCDFAGYSLIAIGVAKIMGFELMKNFNTPYFSTSIQDFWRRWHISLSSFFRDYVFIPLGGSRISSSVTNRNLLITFITSGLWHGANWTFIFWGAIHGFLLVLQKVSNVNFNRVFGWFMTMTLVVVLWILFRSPSILDFYQYLNIIISTPGFPEVGRSMVFFFLYYLIVDLALLKYSEQGDTWFSSIFAECITLAVMIVLVAGTIHDTNLNFIYFQF